MSNCIPCPPCEGDEPLVCEPYGTVTTGNRIMVEDDAFCTKTIANPSVPSTLTWDNGVKWENKTARQFDEFTEYTATGTTEPRNLVKRSADVANVLDFGADPAGIGDSTSAFNNAALKGTTVYIPKGDYRISSQIPTRSFWYLEYGANIVGLSDVSDVNNTRRLTGRVFKIENDASGTGVRIGDSNPWIEVVRQFTESISEVVVASSTGQIGLLAGTRTSDNITPNYAGIGIAGYGINDNATNPEPVWASYLEARRSSGAGAAYCSEMDSVNTGNTFDLTPLTPISPTTGQTSNLWISNGGGDIALGGNQVSAAITILPNPSNFKRGIVFRNGSIDSSTREAIAFTNGHELAWYDLANNKNSYTSQREIYQKTEISNATGSLWSIKKWRASGSATITGDSVLRSDYYGCSGSSTDYAAGFTQVIQRTNFASGDARFSFDIEVKNNDGSPSQVSLNGFANKSFAPLQDNAITLGAPGHRWSVVYAAASSINTSDDREKTYLVIEEAEKLAALEIKKNLRKFRFNSAIELKGEGARIHFGASAQTVAEIMKTYGLEPEKYGFYCYDEWDEIEEKKDEKGNIIQNHRPAGNSYGIRYEELLSFIVSAI
jgi:hypothetical protein